MKIKQIYIYPIKSLRGVTVPSAIATRTGFKYDRRFMLLKVIQNEDGTETLKNMHVPHFPEMALFQTEILHPEEEEAGNDTLATTTTKTATANDKSVLRVSWRPATGSDAEGDERTVEIPLTPDTRGLEELGIMMHLSPTKGYNMGEAYNAWFSACLGYPVVLAYLAEANWRRVLGSFPPGRSAAHQEGGWYADLIGLRGVGVLALFVGIGGARANWWDITDEGVRTALGVALVVLLVGGLLVMGRNRGGKGGNVVKRKEERITFADTSPYMVVSATSVANVSGRLEGEEEMDPTKFRANVMVEGAETAFDEDFWAELDIGGDEKVKMLLTANCVRCRSLDVDYDTGKMGTGESGKVLKKLMGDRRVDRGAKYNPVFGRYGFLDGRVTSSEIRVGDEVVVARRIKERTTYDWPGLV